jgi:hypothetical protein
LPLPAASVLKGDFDESPFPFSGIKIYSHWYHLKKKTAAIPLENSQQRGIFGTATASKFYVLLLNGFRVREQLGSNYRYGRFNVVPFYSLKHPVIIVNKAFYLF